LFTRILRSSYPAFFSIAASQETRPQVYKLKISRLTFFLLLITLSTTSAQLKRFCFTQPKMGSPFTIIFYADDSIKAATLANNSFKLVDSFNLLFSDYIDSSELSRLSASAGNHIAVRLSLAMFDMLQTSKTAFKKSNGAFDISIGPLSKMWRRMRKAKEFPGDSLVKAAKRLTGLHALQLDTIEHTALLTTPGMRLDLGGIAQGWIGQRVMEYLTESDIQHALINVSGDIILSAAPPGTNGWTIGVNVPETKEELLDKTLLLQHKSVSTSGDAYQYTDHNGKRYSHIIDPRTGYGVTSQRNVTVIANDGTTADWLATACSILPIRAAKKLAEQMNAEVLIAQVKNGQLVFKATTGFGKYWKHEKK